MCPTPISFPSFRLGEGRLLVLVSAGLEVEASSGSTLHRTASMTENAIARSYFALFLTDSRFVSDFLLYAHTVLPLLCLRYRSNVYPSIQSTTVCILFVLLWLVPRDRVHPLELETGPGMPDLYISLRPLLKIEILDLLYAKVHAKK
ncbi:unnamed protein product [Sphenostylis stenocarpa]|uniref:Uncharacterized protein n=1 Tax=Sphenostylis stenocarpa TaxID=92480 RepID=A0AA86S9V9_9FABA|nr:unnamed protein product [Sphenostylis stenocarpa]